ncbi:MAG: hypothetical protein MUO97_05855 [Dehalococcoidia bacterium]|nr:hypothetical protein [Dehalococcoidia bacterium]
MKRMSYCCFELRFGVEKGSFEKQSKGKELTGRIITREGMQIISFCPFCGKKIEESQVKA